jgi:hypothetical protein
MMIFEFNSCLSRAFFVRFAADLEEHGVRTALRLCGTLAQKC